MITGVLVDGARGVDVAEEGHREEGRDIRVVHDSAWPVAVDFVGVYLAMDRVCYNAIGLDGSVK